MRQDARDRRLTDATRAGQEVGVRHAARFDGTFQYRRDMRLPNDLIERFGPVFSVKRFPHLFLLYREFSSRAVVILTWQDCSMLGIVSGMLLQVQHAKFDPLLR